MDRPAEPDPDRPELPEELSRSDLALVRQAINQRWPIPAAARKAAIQQIADILDPDSITGSVASLKTKLAATKVLLAADKLNLAQEALDLAREKLEGRTGAAGTVIDAMKVVEEIERLEGDGP